MHPDKSGNDTVMTNKVFKVLNFIMNIYIVSIFPEIFDSFLATSLIKKAQEKKILKFKIINPRDFCNDKHRQIDDTVYGGWAGMLMKAQPLIDAVENMIRKFRIQNSEFRIIVPTPSKDVFDQSKAHKLSKIQNLIFVCGRYEGIDYRFEQYMKKKYKSNFQKISIWQFITMGGEVPAMTMIEWITRLIPGVIKEDESWRNESYSLETKMQNLEHPQYTRPEEVEWIKVPKILLSWHHKNISERKNKNSKKI